MLLVILIEFSASYTQVYKRYLKASMMYAKRKLQKVYETASGAQRTSFEAGGRSFESVAGGLSSSDVIIDCPPGMESQNGTCGG